MEALEGCKGVAKGVGEPVCKNLLCAGSKSSVMMESMHLKAYMQQCWIQL